MFRFSRLKQSRKFSSLFLAVTFLAAIVGVITTSQLTANAADTCSSAGKNYTVKGNIPVAGGNSYDLKFCPSSGAQLISITASSVGQPTDVYGVHLAKGGNVGTLNAGTKSTFICGIRLGAATADVYVLTFADKPLNALGWAPASSIPGTLDGGITTGIKDCADGTAKTGAADNQVQGITSDKSAGSSGSCVHTNQKISVPQDVPVAGNHTFFLATCHLGVDGHKDPDFGIITDKFASTGSISGGVRGTVCGIHAPAGDTDPNNIYLLTQDDNENTHTWGWVHALQVAETYQTGPLAGITPGIRDCGDPKAWTTPNSGYKDPATAPTPKPYGADGTTKTDSGACVPGKTIRVPKVAAASPSDSLKFGGKSYPIAICTNKTVDLKAEPSSSAEKVDQLITTQSFFACGLSGKEVGPTGDNQDWVLTQGDVSHKWGWMKAGYIDQYQNAKKQGVAGTPGIVDCLSAK